MMSLTVPSKTFLLGEYAVLVGSPALVMCTEPRFELHVCPATTAAFPPIFCHPLSPAGKLLTDNSEWYRDYALTFVDPHHGKGGLGASSAQFAMLYALRSPVATEKQAMLALQTYLQYAWEGAGLRPSGADFFAQLHGKICIFQEGQDGVKNLAWPFADADFFLVHTQQKVATHEHLPTVKRDACTDLGELVQQGIAYFKAQNTYLFADVINAYSAQLRARGLMAVYTQELLLAILQQPGVLAAKGCGALGADTLFVMTKKTSGFAQWAACAGLPVIATEKMLSPGLQTTGGILPI